MKKIIISFLVFIQGAIASVYGKTLYISPSGNNGDGLSWSTAFTELNQIKWANVDPGDVIKIDGGTTGITYTTRASLSKSGNSTSRIRIERSTESGHDGKVTVKGGFNVTASYLTLDGMDKNKFEFYQPGANYVLVNNNDNADYFEVKNVYVHNTPDALCWTRSLDVDSGSLSIEDSELFKSQCSEDVIRFRSKGRLKIERSYIHGWESLYVPGMGRGSIKPPCPSSPPYDTGDSLCWSHSDGTEGGGSGHSMVSLIFRNNLVDDDVVETATSRGGNILFMTGYTAWGTVEITNNVFKGIYQAWQSVSVSSLKASNNTFYNTADANFGGTNNIYDSDRQVVWNGATYSLWNPRTPSFVTATGNFKGDPGFLDPTSILGTDGKPFTADDGFNLKSNSAAINKGTSVAGISSDIRGNTYSGLPDIGAYEFNGTTPPLSNPHPADANSDFLMALNEATKYGACWKNPAAFGDCPAGIAIDYAVRAGTLWAGSATGQYQYSTSKGCPLCWEIKP